MVYSKDGKSRLPKPLSHLYAKLKKREIDWRDFFNASDRFRNETPNITNKTTKESRYDDRIAFIEFIDYCYHFYHNITYQGPAMGFTIRDMLNVYNHNLVGKLFADSCAEIRYKSSEYGWDWDRYTRPAARSPSSSCRATSANSAPAAIRVSARANRTVPTRPGSTRSNAPWTPQT